MREPPDPTRHPSLGSVTRASAAGPPCRPRHRVRRLRDAVHVDLRRLRRELRAPRRRRGTRVTDARRRRGAGRPPARPGRDDPGTAVPARGLSGRASRASSACARSLGRRAPCPTAPDVRRARRARRVSTASSTSAWLRPTCSAEPATALHERKAAGLHAGMEFTYRNPDRSTDPGRAVERRPMRHRRCPPVPDRRRRPPRPAGAQGAVAQVRVDRSLRAVARGPAGHRPAAPRRGASSGRVRRRQLDRRP